MAMERGWTFGFTMHHIIVGAETSPTLWPANVEDVFTEAAATSQARGVVAEFLFRVLPVFQSSGVLALDIAIDRSIQSTAVKF